MFVGPSWVKFGFRLPTAATSVGVAAVVVVVVVVVLPAGVLSQSVILPRGFYCMSLILGISTAAYFSSESRSSRESAD